MKPTEEVSEGDANSKSTSRPPKRNLPKVQPSGGDCNCSLRAPERTLPDVQPSGDANSKSTSRPPKRNLPKVQPSLSKGKNNPTQKPKNAAEKALMNFSKLSKGKNNPTQKSKNAAEKTLMNSSKFMEKENVANTKVDVVNPTAKDPVVLTEDNNLTTNELSERNLNPQVMLERFNVREMLHNRNENSTMNSSEVMLERFNVPEMLHNRNENSTMKSSEVLTEENNLTTNELSERNLNPQTVRRSKRIQNRASQRVSCQSSHTTSQNLAMKINTRQEKKKSSNLGKRSTDKNVLPEKQKTLCQGAGKHGSSNDVAHQHNLYPRNHPSSLVEKVNLMNLDFMKKFGGEEHGSSNNGEHNKNQRAYPSRLVQRLNVLKYREQQKLVIKEYESVYGMSSFAMDVKIDI